MKEEKKESFFSAWIIPILAGIGGIGGLFASIVLLAAACGKL